MNKAKEVYYDKNGVMAKSVRYKNKNDFTKVNIEPNTVVHKSSLKLISVSWTNSGVTFWFKDEDGKIYPMTDSVLMKYVKDHPIDFGERDIEFLKQGTVYSIGFVDKNGDER